MNVAYAANLDVGDLIVLPKNFLIVITKVYTNSKHCFVTVLDSNGLYQHNAKLMHVFNATSIKLQIYSNAVLYTKN